MREKLDRYLYRAKEVDNDEWVYGYYWSNDLGHHFIRTTRKTSDNILKDYEIIPETIGQFTGLLDTNGNKIFEGDILKIISTVRVNMRGLETYREFISNQREDYAIVLSDYHTGGYKLKVIHKGKYKRIAKFKSRHLSIYRAEIIGNIYDNPELLKEV